MVKTTVMFISVCTNTERLCGSMVAAQKYCFCFGRLFLTLDVALPESPSLRLSAAWLTSTILNVPHSESDEWAGGSAMCESKKQCSRLIESKVEILVRRSALRMYYVLLFIITYRIIYMRSNRADRFRCRFPSTLWPWTRLQDSKTLSWTAALCGNPWVRLCLSFVKWIGLPACPFLCWIPDLSTVTQRKIRVVNLHAIDMTC